MECSHYYERQKELLKFREEVQILKTQQNTKDLDQLSKLIELKNELNINLSNMKENIKFINQIIPNIEPILKTDEKIKMRQKIANNIKRITEMALDSAKYDNINQEGKTYLDIETRNIIQNLALRVNNHKTHLHNDKMLRLIIQKLPNPDLLAETVPKNNTNIEINFTKPCSESVEEITFSNAYASSPLFSKSQEN